MNSKTRPAPREASEHARKKIRDQADPAPPTTPRRDPIAFGLRAICDIVKNEEARVQELREEILDLSRIKLEAKEDLKAIHSEIEVTAKRLEQVAEAKDKAATQLNSQAGLLLNSLSSELEEIDADAITFFVNLCTVEKQQLEIAKNQQQKLTAATEAINKIKEKKEQSKAELATLERNIVSYQDCIGAMKSLKPQECVVCMTAAATHALLPCGHRSICEQCAKKFGVGSQCPVCRKSVDDVSKIFFHCPMQE